jgi:hypothetical protein
VPRTYFARLRCSYGDHETWIPLEERLEPLEQLLCSPVNFECPAHGVQQEVPLEITETRPNVYIDTGPTRYIPPAKKRKPRSSERKNLHVPVVVYGWAKSCGSFHEETATLVVNSSGGLVILHTNVEMGETFFLVNKTNRQEAEVRVVYIEPRFAGDPCVGLAFKQPSTAFWKTTRRSARLPQAIRVTVHGKDHQGNAYSQTSSTLDVSVNGARLDNLGYLTAPGQVIEVKRRWRGKAKFRVVWIGQIGTQESNQIGICSLEDDKDLWRVRFPEAPHPKA